MKKYNPIKKLLVGVILFVSFCLSYKFIGTNGLYDIQSYVEKHSFESKGIASIFSNLIMIFIGIVMLYCGVSGLYRICTFNLDNPVFDNVPEGGIPVKGSDSYPNINRVLSYRESKLAGLSPDKGADLYIGSSKLDSLYTGYNGGPETLRTLSYIESKLCSMSSDKALNYLANKL